MQNLFKEGTLPPTDKFIIRTLHI